MRASGMQLVEHRGDARHTGGERDGFATLQKTNNFLQRLPRRRTVVSRIGAISAENEVRREQGRDVQRRARASVAPSRDEQRFGRRKCCQMLVRSNTHDRSF